LLTYFLPLNVVLPDTRLPERHIAVREIIGLLCSNRARDQTVFGESFTVQPTHIIIWRQFLEGLPSRTLKVQVECDALVGMNVG